MSVETELFSLLKTLVDGRCYPDTTPDDPTFPCIVFQTVGGMAYEYANWKLPECEHFRVQVNSWAKTRIAASALALDVRQHIIEYLPWPYAPGAVAKQYVDSGIRSTRTYGQATSLYEEALKLYGTRQDFGIWIKVR